MKLRELLGNDAALEPAVAALDVTGIALDSRAVKPGDLFFALAGSKTDGARTLGTRVRDWFNGGDPDGRAKLRAWATGDDGRWRGYTHSMGKYVTWLMVIACVLYPFTRGIGSILALLVAIFLMGGRAMIERQVRRVQVVPEAVGVVAALNADVKGQAADPDYSLTHAVATVADLRPDGRRRS